MNRVASQAVRRRRRRLAARGIGMPGDNAHIIRVARQLRTKVIAPVLGGIAVYLHGGGRATVDLDFYTVDRRKTADELEAAGARWDPARREHVLDAVRIHMVTPQEAKHIVGRSSIIDGVRVVSLKDLIAIKLLCGNENVVRSKDIGDVVELIQRIPLGKSFAGKLPAELRATFKKLVSAVEANEAARRDQPRF